MEDLKRISIKEFREKGYLQELNRKFLHPLGLALEVIVSDDGNETLGGILDYRTQEEGIYFDIKNSDKERKDKFLNNSKFIEEEFIKRRFKRVFKLGFNIEPIE